MDLKPGKYRHFKGKEYELIGIASHSETLEPMVVYRALYGDGSLWVRPAAMWTETVERDGYHGPRFQYIGGEYMNICSLIDRLKEAGLTFDAGLNDQELEKIEIFFGFRFPSEIRTFLACAYPTSPGFFPWRDCTDENLARFYAFYEDMEDAFRFDFEENGLPFDSLADILQQLHDSPKLIPFYKHRCFFSGMDGMPIVSFWQPIDSILYGRNFEDYLQVEFLGKEPDAVLPNDLLHGTGIWEKIID